ncbi:hypothetical protein ACSBR2_021175 [Camellia fascicularis]
MSQVIETTRGMSTRISSGVRSSRMTSADVEDTAGLTADEKRLVYGWGIRIVVFFIEHNFLLRKRVLYFVYGVRKPVQNCIWLGMVLIAWHYLFDKRVERETNIKFLLFVNKVLVCFLVGALLWLVKTLVVKDDEERTMAEVWNLQKLQRTSSQKFSRSSSKKQGEGILIDHLHKLNPKNISAWNMKRLIKIVCHGVLSTLDEQILESTNGDESTMQIRSELEAKVNAFRERRALSLTLNDAKTAVNKLHQMVNVPVGIIIAVVCLLILGIATSRFLLFMSSQIVVVAFIFGNSCKTIFEAIIFLFVMHAFDMIVEEMNILTTVFLRFDNQKIIYPNSTLSMKPISNYYRSLDMGDTIEFCVYIATPIEKNAIIRQRIISCIESKKDHWYPSLTVVPMNLEELNKLKISVWLRHRMNHQDMHEIVTLNLILNTACFPLTSTFSTCPLQAPPVVPIIMTIVKLSMIELMKSNK